MSVIVNAIMEVTLQAGFRVLTQPFTAKLHSEREFFVSLRG